MNVNDSFNAAINYAIDSADGDGLLFLSMWREGDWPGIKEDFPDFDLTTAPTNPVAIMNELTTKQHPMELQISVDYLDGDNVVTGVVGVNEVDWCSINAKDDIATIVDGVGDPLTVKYSTMKVIGN